MPTLEKACIAALLAPYYQADDDLLARLSVYLDLLLRWNAHTNLSAVRHPEEIVTRHFGESLFITHHLKETQTLLDLGSGAGFPGLPIQLARPDLEVTLAESQNKKATFLREVVRTLALPTKIWAARAETLPHPFDVVTLRAVDNMQLALQAAIPLASKAIIALVGTSKPIPAISGFTIRPLVMVPGTLTQRLLIANRDT